MIRAREVSMPTLGLPGMPRWAVAATRVLVTGIPTLIAVGFGGLILFIGIFLGKQRRDYALKAARCVIDMVRTLSGPPNDPERHDDGGNGPDTQGTRFRGRSRGR
jgi:hypothetical protein